MSQEVLSQYVNNVEESATLRMAQLARNLAKLGEDVISLSVGEPDFDTPKFIIDAAKQALDDGYTHYTPVPGLPELREAIVTKLKRDNKLNYKISNIVVSNGAKQSISNICHALINPGDEVIIFTPYWVSYIEIVKIAGGTPICLSADVQNDYKVTAQQVKDAMSDKVKFVLFSSPCNPTGSIYTKEELKEIADVIEPYKNTYVVSDEIYENIVFDGAHASIAQNDGIFERTIVVNGMSKGFAMTGWRLGYMAAPEFIAKACAKIQGQVTSGASSFGQKAASVALLSDSKEPQAMTEVFKKRRDMVLDELNKIEGMKLSIPSGAFYIFPDVSHFFGLSYKDIVITDSNVLAETLLTKRYVATVAGAAFGAPNCIRLSYAASEEKLLEACRRIRQFLSELK